MILKKKEVESAVNHWQINGESRANAIESRQQKNSKLTFRDTSPRKIQNTNRCRLEQGSNERTINLC